MNRALKISIGAAAMAALASVAHAGDEGEPAQNCEGNTFQIVECLKAQTARWDKRMTVAYQKGLKDAGAKQREQLHAAQRCGSSTVTPIACITASVRAPSPGSMRANACAT
jgi:hypothetical protein